MYSRSYYEKIDHNKSLYFTVINGSISIIYLTELEADKYRNKYGSLHKTRAMAIREISS